MLQYLPEFAFRILVEEHLSDLEKKTLRLVCKDCEVMVDTILTALRVKDIEMCKLLKMAKQFKNLESLDLTRGQQDRYHNAKDYQPKFEELTALKRLKSLKVYGDKTCNLIRQVIPAGGLIGLSTLHYDSVEALVDDDLCALSSMVNLRELALCNANGGCGDCYEGITGTGLIFLRDLPQLQKLDVSGSYKITAEGLHALAALTQLTALHARGALTPIDGLVGSPTRDNYSDDSSEFLSDDESDDNPRILPVVFTMTGLRELDLSDDCLIPYQKLLSQLASLSRLTALEIGYWHDSPPPAVEGSALLSLPELRVLRAHRWHVYFEPRAASVGNVSNAKLTLSELRTSTWSHAYYEGLLHVALRGGKLETLRFSGVFEGTMRNNFPHLWAEAAALTYLKFHYCEMDTLPDLRAARSLKCLIFQGCSEYFGEAEDLRQLSSLTALTKLQLGCCLFNDRCLSPILGRLSALVTLSIPSSEAVTSELVGKVAQLSNLQDLDLCGVSATWRPHDLCRPLSTLTQLRALGYSGLIAEDQDLSYIRHLRNLRSLKLSGGNFTDIGLCMLTGLKALRSLNLSFCNNITDEGFRAVVIPLSRHSLAQVDVSHRDGATPLSSASSMGVVCCDIVGLREYQWQ